MRRWFISMFVFLFLSGCSMLNQTQSPHPLHRQGERAAQVTRPEGSVQQSSYSRYGTMSRRSANARYHYLSQSTPEIRHEPRARHPESSVQQASHSSYGTMSRRSANARYHYLSESTPEIRRERMARRHELQQPRHEVVTRHLPYFVNVNVKFPINVRLHTGYKNPEVILSGDAHDIPLVQTTVRNQTLYITMGSLKPHMTKKKIMYGPIDIDIRMPTIHQLIYRGKGSLVGNNITSQNMEVILNKSGTTHLDGKMNLHKLTVVGEGYTEINGIQSDHLDVYLRGRPKVQMTGVANMSDIYVLGAPKMSFYWLKAPYLKLRARGNGGVIQIGGMTDKLDVELSGNIRFDGRYIRAKETFVKTHEHSIAEIATGLHQHTLAMDASDIYYYNLPITSSNFMADDGAVLDMRSWELQLDQPFSSHNKPE